MPKIDNEAFYKAAIKKYAQSAQGVNWASLKNQQLRFKIIAQMLPSSLDTYSLGDAGCGFGDFYGYLLQNKRVPKHYSGIDTLEEMCTIAAKNISGDVLHLDICKEDIPPQDYYISSGALNILTPYETYQFIHNCYNAARFGFIFNILYGETKSPTYNYMTKERIETVAKELGVREVLYKEGYIEKDITVGFMK